jgi:hypothetical protein
MATIKFAVGLLLLLSLLVSVSPLTPAVAAPGLYSPEAGVSGVPLAPIFQWSAIAGADSYELLVATDASFTNPIIIKLGTYALPATVT